MALNHLKLVILLTILTCIHTNSQTLSQTFANYTGKGIKPEMVSNYIKIINSAYSFYANDLNKTTNFISSQLQSAYGLPFSVQIQTFVSPYLYYSWNIKSFGDSVVAWSGVNSYKPDWGYLIWPNQKYSGQTSSAFIQDFAWGEGITQEKASVIKNILQAQDSKYKECYCYNSDLLISQQKMKMYDGQDWSIICQQFRSSFHSWNTRIQSKGDQYLTVFSTGSQGSACEYLLATNGKN